MGHPGGGGEYIVQEGFGWTNGVILWILQIFGNDLVVPEQCVMNESSHVHASKSNRLVAIVANLIFSLALFFKTR